MKIKKNHTLKGTTLIEVIIATIIISLLVGLVLQAKSMFNRQQQFIGNADETGKTWYNFTLLIERDYYQGKQVYWNENLNTLQCQKQNNETITYTFEEGFIVRKQLFVLDTFNIATENYFIKGFGNENESVIIPAKIQFDIIYKTIKIPFVLQKDIPVDNKLSYPDVKAIEFNELPQPKSTGYQNGITLINATQVSGNCDPSGIKPINRQENWG